MTKERKPMNRLEKITVGLAYGLMIGGLSIGALLWANKKPIAGMYTGAAGMIGGLISASFALNSYESRNKETNYQI